MIYVSAEVFLLTTLTTVVVTRVFLYFKPIASPTMFGIRLHHYMYGVALVIVGVTLNSVILYAIGVGLFIDELTFLLTQGKDHKDNYSRVSLWGTIFFLILVFIFRDVLVQIL